MKSVKETHLDKGIRKMLFGLPLAVFDALVADQEVSALQEYANTVSIMRLGYNDHGPVHMRKVTANALTILRLLHDAGIQLTLEREELGGYEDSTVAVLLAAFLHDIGMSVGRAGHENHSAVLAVPIIDRVLGAVYPDDIMKRVILRSTAVEGIVGHMASSTIHSYEAGIILVADGCDMEKGRARIPLLLNRESRVGDIHKYSASSIEKVTIGKGEERPIRITVEMTASVGFFQIEEVLFGKLSASPINQFIELHAGVMGREMKRYQ